MKSVTAKPQGHGTLIWRCAFFCCLLLNSSGAVAQASDPAAGCSSSEVVLQRYIDAIGGKQAIEKLQTRNAEADESEPYSFKPQETSAYKFKFKWKAPNQVRVQLSHIVRPFSTVGLGFGSGTFIFDGSQWSDNRGKSLPPQRNEQPWRKRLMFDYPHNAMRRVTADPLMMARPAELYSHFELDSEAPHDPGVCVLQAWGKDHRLDRLYFDAQTGLLKKWDLQMVQPRNSFYITFQFDDYRQAGDVKFPFYVYVDFYKAAYRYTKVEHNLPIKDEEFRMK